ncbi:hypothetical protein L9F63_021100, partial [Diploptera punctata]
FPFHSHRLNKPDNYHNMYSEFLHHPHFVYMCYSFENIQSVTQNCHHSCVEEAFSENLSTCLFSMRTGHLEIGEVYVPAIPTFYDEFQEVSNSKLLL